MLLSAVSVLFVAQSSSEIPEGLMNNPVHDGIFFTQIFSKTCLASHKSNPSSVPRGIIDSYSNLSWVTLEEVAVVEGTPS